MNVAIVQYDPLIGEIERNMTYVNSMIENLSINDQIDILLLPEMAFTGYVFSSKEEVQVLAEFSSSGPTYKWCRLHAKRLQCMVVCGYVEKEFDEHKETTCLYNALLVVDPDGVILCNPRKHFLYETDKLWATPGDSFTSYHYSRLDITIAFGICMDINPKDFIAPFRAWEFANYAISRSADLILFACAWCTFEPLTNDIMAHINYWFNRLLPIHSALNASNYGVLVEEDIPKDECYFLLSNRVGHENGTQFVGSSCAISLKEPVLLNSASVREETVFIVDIPLKKITLNT